MPGRFGDPNARLAFRRTAPLALLALLPLSACGGDDEKFAPPCPVPSIPRDTADLHRFRGAGRDIIDSVLDGRITPSTVPCTRGDRGFVTATVSVGLDLTRGPATPGRRATVSYFIAVTEGRGDSARIPGQAGLHAGRRVPPQHGPPSPGRQRRQAQPPGNRRQDSRRLPDQRRLPARADRTRIQPHEARPAVIRLSPGAAFLLPPRLFATRQPPAGQRSNPPFPLATPPRLPPYTARPPTPRGRVLALKPAAEGATGPRKRSGTQDRIRE